MLENLALTDFEPYLDTPMVFRAANAEFSLTLAEALPLKQPSPRPVAPFRLTFRSPERYRVPQGLYELQHPQHGPIQLMMVPLQPDAHGALFEVIFN